MDAKVSRGAADGAEYPRHVSGLWLGEALPDSSLAAEIPVNPIRWSASLTRPDIYGETSPSFFGAGYFDDAGDVEGSPVIFYTLRGNWDPRSGVVDFQKIYETDKISGDLIISYSGRVDLRRRDGQPVITGTWSNNIEGTFGTFAARLEG